MDGKKQTKRLQSVDLLKGMVMASIVFVHLVCMVPKDTLYGDTALPLQILYFGMMLFLLFSGYFYRSGRTILQNIWRRCKQLIPAIVLSIIVPALILYVYLTALGQAPGIHDLEAAFIRLFGGVQMLNPPGQGENMDWGLVNNYTGQYFLQMMLFAFIVFYIAAEYVGESIKRISVAIIILLFVQVIVVETMVILPLNLSMVPIATAFMFLGRFAASKELIEWMETRPVKDRRYWLLVLISAVVMVCMCVALPPDVQFDKAYFGEYGGWSAFPYFIEASATMIVMIFIGTWLMKSSILTRGLSAVGRHTLAIICLHPFVIKLIIAPFHKLTPDMMFPKLPITEVAVVGLLTIVIITLFYEYAYPAIVEKIKNKLAENKSN